MRPDLAPADSVAPAGSSWAGLSGKGRSPGAALRL